MAIVLMSCGGYVKKDELEKRLSDQQMTVDQRISLVSESATKADDKATSVSRDMDKVKREILVSVDEKVNKMSFATKEDLGDTEGIKLIAEQAASRALSEAKSTAATEAERVRQSAKQDNDKAMAAALEANRKAEEAARLAELAKELSKSGDKGTVFNVYFDLGKANLKAEGVAELEKAANMIKDKSFVVEIVGHADNTPSPFRSRRNNNWTLSENRAKAVRDYLVNNLGVSAESIKKCAGLAEYNPVALNDKTNKWQNRRVEVIVKPSS